MTLNRVYRMLLSAALAAVLGISPILAVSAAELPEEAEPQIPETTLPLELPEPGETVAPTVGEPQPAETAAPTVPETAPAETAAPTVPETQPEETAVPTVPETQPMETTSPTVPETEPEETEAVEWPEPTDPTESTESTQPVQVPSPPISTTAPTAAPQETETPDPTSAAVTVAQAWAMSPGTDLLTLRGTVVFVSGTQAVLQDSTGGMRLSFSQTPGVSLGTVLEVTGMRSGGFTVTEFTVLGTAALPALETTLYDAPENLRVLIRNAAISGGELTQNGTSIALVATLPASAEGTRVDACGVILDGRFYADSILPSTSSAETAAETGDSYNLYFGQLHAHTDLSDGVGSVEEAFAYAANIEGLDFFAVTDHSNSFDNANAGDILTDGTTVSAEWARGKAAAAAVTDEDFVGIFGYEMTWTDELSLGHINTFNTPGWQTRSQAGFGSLEAYYQALTAAPDSISQFNHPYDACGNFEYFSCYSPDYDRVIQLLEVGDGGGSKAYELYNEALDQGWHLAPTNNQNNHAGLWGDASGARTVILARTLTEESLFEAIRSYRVYATQDSDLSIRYQLNGNLMGSIIGAADRMTVSLEAEDPTDSAIGTVAVIADGGTVVATRTLEGSAGSLSLQVPVGYSYYYLRITQPDGDIAVTAPVWVDSYENLGIRSFTADTQAPAEGQDVTLTLELFNEENTDFVLEKVEFFLNDSFLEAVSQPGTVAALEDRSYGISYSCTAPGELCFRAEVTGTVAGQSRSYEKSLILRCQSRESTAITPISQVRAGMPGASYRVSGYITAGNENPYNTFPNTLYLQDDFGGIALTGTVSEEVKVGDPMTVSGVLLEQGGNLALELTGYEWTGGTAYRYAPETIPNALATNYAINGGELLQVEGQVVSLTQTADGKGISRFTIRDAGGNLATVVIEDYIRSGAHGTNTLASKVKKGRTVRAIGLLHVDEYGQSVLRVRNCDEVVYVPPTADPSNPKTGDWLWFWKYVFGTDFSAYTSSL